MNHRRHPLAKTQPIPPTVTPARNPDPDPGQDFLDFKGQLDDRWSDGLAVAAGCVVAFIVVGSFIAGWAFHHLIHP